MYLGNDSPVKITAVGDFGVLKNVLVVPRLTHFLISTKQLAIDNDFLIIHDKRRAFIIDKQIAKHNVDKCIIATATVHSDGLYHIDDVRKFLCHTINETKRLYLSKTSIDKQQTRGSAKIKFKATTVGLNPLEILHLKLGHANETLIKWCVKHGIVMGTGYTYDEIKNLTLPLCDACMRGKMKAFPIPASISERQYGIFEYHRRSKLRTQKNTGHTHINFSN